MIRKKIRFNKWLTLAEITKILKSADTDLGTADPEGPELLFVEVSTVEYRDRRIVEVGLTNGSESFDFFLSANGESLMSTDVTYKKITLTLKESTTAGKNIYSLPVDRSRYELEILIKLLTIFEERIQNAIENPHP